MTINTKIEWCDHTINFWWGCEKVSPGCAHCYAEGFAKRVGDGIWGRGKPRRWIKSAVSEARKLNAKAEREGVRYKVFANSMSDFFEDDHGQPIVNKDGVRLGDCPACGIEVYTENEPPLPEGCENRFLTLTNLRQQAFQVFDECQNIDWLLVTKRPENIRALWADDGKTRVDICGMDVVHRKNVWLLTSVENQEQADQRIPQLLRCRDLVPVLGLSMEPLLGSVRLPPSWNYGNFDPDFDVEIDWVIAGGESGHHARPMHPDWVRGIRDQCQSAGVPFFFKQGSSDNWDSFKDFNSFPKDLQKRDFPNAKR